MEIGVSFDMLNNTGSVVSGFASWERGFFLQAGSFSVRGFLD